ncbi:MAG: prepilin-type N-terminal cleavage/methylation domain-containing protein [Phycisphaerae bacterium]|nr:prepilin-type N-terminal cleavage/methylation domain-containing protein [Phycisphaerae bacterium]
MTRRAFTLIELLVVVVIVVVLVAILLPVLASAREATRSTRCLSNLRQVGQSLRAYADDHKGYSPALGQPYGALPNWALVVQSHARGSGATPADLYSTQSVLVCTSARAFYGLDMTRTYAANVTGHAGLPGDPDNYDDARGIDQPAFRSHLRLDLIARPSDACLAVDSSSGPIAGGAPPPTRTASVLDFRQPAHVSERLGRYHGHGFNAAFADGSARSRADPDPAWASSLP